MASKKNKMDWTYIEAEYISTSISLRKLAQKYKISISTMANVSRKNGWVEKRKNYQNNIVTKVTQKIANEAAKKLSKEFKIADQISDVLIGALKDEKQFNRYIVNECMDGTFSKYKEKTFQKVDTKSILEAVKALKEIANIKTVISGITTVSEQRKIDMDNEKLAIEKRKIALAESKEKENDSEEEYGVILMGEVDPDTREEVDPID